MAAAKPKLREREDSSRNPEAGRRADIIRAAARLFRDNGFDATTVRDIGNAVGMQSGSLFYHFNTKTGILHAVIAEGLLRGIERLEAAAAEHANAEARFRALIRVQYGIIHDRDADFIGALIYDWRRLPAGSQTELIALKDRFDRIFQDAIEALHADGRISSADPLVRLLLFGAINLSITWYRADRRLPLDEIAERTADFFLGKA
jgi:AcrR family transcriptional regulator